MPSTRPPAVAGTFYPADPTALARSVDELLAQAARSQTAEVAPKAIIAPHAGYVYSGPVAASAYSRLRCARGRIRRVVLLGPVHRVAVRGLALPGTDAFETPLGTVPIDPAAVALARTLPQVSESAAAHRHEHALEVQLPFLQRVLGDFALVPFAVGDATAEEVAGVLERLWGGEETLIVVSSDLSHYLAYDAARTLDAQTAAMILDLRSDIDHERACGGTPLNGLLLAARRRRLEVQLLDLRSSGDAAGGRDRVVGYGAFAVFARDTLRADTGPTLITVARTAIAEQFGEPPSSPTSPGWLAQPGATFVTLTRNGDLRGCIGSLEARRPLGDDVRANALGAAFRDPRFSPLSREEWRDTRVEVSLLSPLEALDLVSEEALLATLRPGVDGVLIEYGHHRSTFLPQVWEQLPKPREFLANLRRKAGLPPDFFDPGFKVWRYTVAKWREHEPSAD